MSGARRVGEASMPAPSLRTRRHLTIGFVSLVLGLLLATMAIAIALAQRESKAGLRSTFHLRAMSSATFISTFLTQQAAREAQTARTFFSGRSVPAGRFPLVVEAFGSNAAVLLDSAGRLLDAAPRDPALIGKPIAARYAHLQAAEEGRVAVSNIVRSAARGLPVTAVAVPFSTPYGRRVFSAAYPVAGSTLGAFVAHAVPYRQHEVYLVDAYGQLLAASPTTAASTLKAADPLLARAVSRASEGALEQAHVPSTFTVAPVGSSSWRLIIAVPDSRLYASIGGWAQRVPWIVFALVSMFGVSLAAVLWRSLADRSRLAALSRELEKAAHTDPVTGLPNRRALSERLVRAMIHARRHCEPFSVLMIDLDCFKQINDTLGHDGGDQVLVTVARCLEDVFRGDDIYGRWGGDEFLVALPATGEEGARVAAERLLETARAASSGEFALNEGVPLSIGVATGTYTTPEHLIQSADAALYRSKAEGGGQITTSVTGIADVLEALQGGFSG
jgi:diguanylate cyclase (GGDEF)-like protein